MRPAQDETLAALRDNGALVVVARSLGEVVELFAHHFSQYRDDPAGAALWRAIRAYRAGMGGA